MEYKLIRINTGNVAQAEEELNTLGAEGWYYVGSNQLGPSVMVVLERGANTDEEDASE